MTPPQVTWEDAVAPLQGGQAFDPRYFQYKVGVIHKYGQFHDVHEEVEIWGDSAFVMGRMLTPQFTPDETSGLYIGTNDNQGKAHNITWNPKTALLFPKTAPCPQEKYTQWSYGHGDSPLCHTFLRECKGYADWSGAELVDTTVVDPQKIQALTPTFPKIMEASSFYYANYLRDILTTGLPSEDAWLLSTRTYWVGSDGVLREKERSLRYNSGAYSKAERHGAWELAQKCDSIRQGITERRREEEAFLAGPETVKIIPANCASSDVNVRDALECFQSRRVHLAVWDYWPNLPHYDTKLVGTKEPSYPVEVSRIGIFDAGANGVTNSVFAEWEKAPGEFGIGGRSLYTKAALSTFDPLWSMSNETEFPSLVVAVAQTLGVPGTPAKPVKKVIYETQAPALEINLQKDQRVSKGEALFIYSSPKGVRETVRAPFDATVCWVEDKGFAIADSVGGKSGCSL